MYTDTSIKPCPVIVHAANGKIKEKGKQLLTFCARKCVLLNTDTAPDGTGICVIRLPNMQLT